MNSPTQPLDADEIAAAFGLDRAVSRVVEAARGWGDHNIVYRLDTASGGWAIKALVRELDDLMCERFDIEVAAYDGGVAMPKPVPSTDGAPSAVVAGVRVRCHEWVAGVAKHNEDTNAADSQHMGAVMARLHVLDLPWDAAFDRQLRSGGASWEELCDEGQRRGAPWASVLADNFATISALHDRAVLLRAAEAAAHRIGSHRDLNAHNVLFASDLSLIDWDAAGPATAAFERANYSTLWASRRGGHYDLDALVSFLRSYRDAGGALSEDDPCTLELLIENVEDWTRKNVRWAIQTPTPQQDLAVEALLQGLLATPTVIDTRQYLLDDALERLRVA